MQIRAATADDIPAIVGIADRTCARYGPVCRWVLQWWAEGGHRFTVAEVDGVLVGASVVTPVQPEPWWECRLLAVEPARHRRGVGRALLEADIVAARDAGQAEVFLTTSEDNAPMRALVKAIGFREHTALRGLGLRYPDGGRALVLSAQVQGAPSVQDAGCPLGHAESPQ